MSIQRDFNDDGIKDTFSINKATKQGTLLLSSAEKGKAKTVKVIDGISNLKQLKEIHVIGENVTINIEQ